jgi:cysteine desulfurase
MEKRKVYLDNNATTPIRPEVKELMISGLDIFGNPSSHHSFGKESRKKVEAARKSVADLIGALPEEIYFTSGGSESNNIVLKGSGCASLPGAECVLGCTGRRGHIITSRIEHPSVLSTCRCLMTNQGYDITFLDVDKDGLINLDDLEKAIRPETVLISIMYANNEIGTIQPIKKISEICKKHNKMFHTDAVQAAGKIELDVKTTGVDFMSLSGHKLYGPKGIGVLFIRKELMVCPLITGGHQERGLRAGTENLLGIIGIGEAARLAKTELYSENERLSKLRDFFEKSIIGSIDNVKINGSIDHRLPNTSNISFRYIEGEAILYRLDYNGIAVSTGSACSSGSLEPSHVLMAIGLDHEMAHGSIRVSLGHNTVQEDIDYTVSVFPEVISSLRMLSPFL